MVAWWDFSASLGYLTALLLHPVGLIRFFQSKCIVLQGFSKGSVYNVSREQLKATHRGYCYSTGLHTSSSIRCESRKCINFTVYDQLASRVLRLILADLINVHKTWTYNRKTNWLHFNKHCKFWIAAHFFASGIFIHFYNLKRALLWSSEKRWPFHTRHAGLLNVAVWRLVCYIQEHTLVAKISKTTCYLQRRF